MSEHWNRPLEVMPSEIEVTTVKLYRQQFEKRVYVIESDPEGSTRCAARCRAILSDLFKLIGTAERRLTTEVPSDLLVDWAFYFEG